MPVHGYNLPKDYLFEEAWLMSKLCIKYKRVILVIGRKDICGVSLSLYIARNGSILQFLHNLLDCKRLCLSRPQLLQFSRPSRLCSCKLNKCVSVSVSFDIKGIKYCQYPVIIACNCSDVGSQWGERALGLISAYDAVTFWGTAVINGRPRLV